MMSDYIDGHDIINIWFESDAWDTICKDADKGCEDSQEFMEVVLEYLNNLIFHMNNESGEKRVRLEIEKFQELLHDFDIKY